MTMLPRTLDKVYLWYFTIVLLLTIFIDTQDYWPEGTGPEFLRQIKQQYLVDSGDPLLTRTLGGRPQMAWFDSLVFQEFLFQFPALCLIVGGILRAWRSTYIWILAYCVSSVATTIPCIYTFLVIPDADAATPIGTLALSPAQKRFLLYNYVPFVVIPLIAAVDSGMQLAEDVKLAVSARKAMETKTQ
ncbi:hypothetical protein FS837_001793 [Tulasnella sp. UAMH 9824]|nr:hypothetical protein FS837_001793 [Tulasnella sp. UAMH 9824]